MKRVDICLCTFRRESVTDTLASLMAIEVPDDVAVSVIVADNDETPSARALVENFAEGARLPVRYVHAPARNISIARNAALDASDAEFAAFVDDDETVTPGWLAALLKRQAESRADVVLGPVAACYDETSPRWMRATGVHGTRPVWVEGEIRTGYTCNVLIDRTRPEIRDLRFDIALGRSGGEDTIFFGRIHDLGGRFAYADTAVVEEIVTPARQRFGWLAVRRYRMGQTHARLLLAEDGTRRWQRIPVAAVKLGWCALSCLVTLPSERRRNMAILRGCLHAGVIATLAGRPAITLYGSAAPPGRQVE